MLKNLMNLFVTFEEEPKDQEVKVPETEKPAVDPEPKPEEKVTGL